MQARLVGPEHVILRISHVAKQANEEIAPGTARNVRVALKGQARDSAERAQRRAEARDQPILQRVDALVQPACVFHCSLSEQNRRAPGARDGA